jgi:hypothetical protein
MVNDTTPEKFTVRKPWKIHVFLITALVGGKWSASRSDRFTPGKRALGTHWIGEWVDRETGLDDLEKRFTD